jgi:hypothetical protein
LDEAAIFAPPTYAVQARTLVFLAMRLQSATNAEPSAGKKKKPRRRDYRDADHASAVAPRL